MQNFEKLKSRATKFIVGFLSGTFLLGAAAPALAQTKDAGKKLNLDIRNQIKMARLQAEMKGDKFVPTQEMLQEAPEFVKSQMDIHQNYLTRFTALQKKAESAEARVKLFQVAYKNGGASLGELQKIQHRHKALKSKILQLQSKALSDIENIMLDSTKNNNDNEMALNIKMARIKAELNNTEFKPTEEMKQAKPNLVNLEMKIFKNRTEHLSLIDARIDMSNTELQLSESAHKKGVISKTELLTIKRDLNKLANSSLLLQANILQEREHLEYSTAAEKNLEMANKVKQDRIHAQLSGKTFTPTDEMKTSVPKIVELEQKIFDNNSERLKLLTERESLLKENFKLVSAAHQSGVANDSEYQDAKDELNKIQFYLKKLANHMERELRFAQAS